MKVEKKMMMEIVKKNINITGLVFDSMDQVLKPVLDDFVKDSSNPYDDMLIAALYPVLDKEIKAKVKELVDKLFEVEE